MKFTNIIFFIFSLPTFVYAQTTPIELTQKNIEVLVTIPDLEIQKKVSDLEDQHKTAQIKTDCTDRQASLDPEIIEEKTEIPKKLKESGWKVLFEVKYMPEVEAKGFTPTSQNQYIRDKQLNKNQEYLQENNIDLTQSDFNLDSYRNLSQQINQTSSSSKDGLYSLMLNRLQETKNNEDLFKVMGEMSSQMTDGEYLEFLSSIAGWAPYNDERAEFKQTEGGGKGKVSPWQMVTSSKDGVCGDIHSSVAKFAEIRGWEAFTIGYAPYGGENHVITAMVDPNNPDKVYLINYSTLEVSDLNENNSLRLSPGTPGWKDIGLQYRIFKNDKPGEDGKMQQIGTLPTPLQGFFKNLVDAQFLPKPAMPQNQNYRQEKVEFANEREVTKWQKDGDKLVKNISQGVAVYEGQADSAKVFGVAVSHEVYKTLYDEQGQTKKNKYFSLLMAASDLQFDMEDGTNLDTYYVYLNMQGGRVLKLIESSHFKLGGIIGYQLEGFGAIGRVSPNDPYDFFTGGGADGSLDTFLQVYAEYSKGDHNLKLNLRSDFTLGLRDQNLMTDFSTLPKNLNPFVNNGIAVGGSYNYAINPQRSLQANGDLTVSRLGNWVSISTGLVTPKSSIMLNYSGGAGGMRLPGNSIQSLNLLSGVVGPSRLTANYNYHTNLGNHSMSIGGFAGVQMTTPRVTPIAGGSLKINLNTNKKTKMKY